MIRHPVPSDMPPLRLSWHREIAAIEPRQWDALVAPGDSPFLRWQWLNQLECSRSAAPETGWLPYHLSARRDGRLVGAAALYVKRHSRGEFVFDEPWAKLAQRLRVRYYPKLVGMVPFTPVAGYRFLLAPQEDAAALTAQMLGAIQELCQAEDLGGCHLLHVDPDWAPHVQACGFIPWVHPAFVWRNRGFNGFAEYLASFQTNQRRNIQRERRAMQAQGLRLEVLTGEAICPQLASLLYRYYSRTNEKFGPWGCKYLTESFFHGIFATFAQHLAVVSARPTGGGEALGLALLATNGQRLYGRYWGAAEDVAQLHFNVCYYTPIEWAIAHGIETYDPGMGGLHKVRRGFEAVPNLSLHRLMHPELHAIMAHYLPRINSAEQSEIDVLNRAVPFRRI